MSDVTNLIPNVSVRLDAREVLDHIESMLAWLAVASTDRHVCLHEDFRRATPMIRVNDNSWGELTPTSVECSDNDAFVLLPEKERVQFTRRDWEYAQSSMPVLINALDRIGERPRASTLTEFTPGDEVLAAISGTGRGGVKDLNPYRIVEDVDGESDLRTYGTFHGVKWLLESLGQCAKAEADTLKRAFALPQMSRVFVMQTVAVFVDGQSASQNMGFWTDGKSLWHLSKQRQRAVVVSPRDGTTIPHPVVPHVVQLICNALKRIDKWDIELCLSRDRTGVALSTDAVGAKEFIKEVCRESGAVGRSREAIVHWVREHMRRSRKEGADPHLVRAHLRGKQVLRAGDYHVRIYPSRQDIDRAINGKRFIPADHV